MNGEKKMLQNLELKLKIDNFDEIKKDLERIKAEYKGLLVQKDIYYTSKFGLLKLRNVNGKFELIQYLRDEDQPDRWSNYEILEITDPNAEKFLSNIFNVEAIVEKERELYIWKNTRIHLDNVKLLGTYLELETVVNDNKFRAKEEFDELVKQLNLDLTNQIKTSYRYLIETI